MAEIVRAGILSVDEGQTEAASALGMTRLQTHPPDRAATGNAGDHPADRQRDDLDAEDQLAGERHRRTAELLYSAQLIYSVNYRTIPLLIVASIWYLVLTTMLSIGQYYLERHFGRGTTREPPPTPLQRLRRNLFGIRRTAAKRQVAS